MTAFNVNAFSSGTITASGTYQVTMLGSSHLFIDNNANVIFDTLSISALSTITINSGSLTIEADISMSVATTIEIANGATLDISNAGGIDIGSAIKFTGTSGTLVLGDTGGISLLSKVYNLTGNKTILLTNGHATHATVTGFIDKTLNLIDAGGTTLYSIALGTGCDLNPAHYNFVDDGQGGTVVVACYLAGARIATPFGERAIETLRIGQHVLTASGTPRRIRWIGRRAYARRDGAANGAVMPVRIRAGALGQGIPRRDLYVSPRHAMLIDGVLVPAEALIDGDAIAVCHHFRTVEYFHIELDRHDIVYAEGAPSESFCDRGNRDMFHNAHTFAARYPDAASGPQDFCAPLVESGPQLAAIRSAIATPRPKPHGRLLGHIELVNDTMIEGWAVNEGDPDRPVELVLMRNGLPLQRITATRYRPDLEMADLAGGRCAFRIPVPGSGPFALRRLADLALLPLAPTARQHSA